MSIRVWGTIPFSRCFLCQTPPRARNTVESRATARPPSAHGRIWATSCCPIRPIRAGSDSGRRARRRSQVLREGNRPCRSVKSARMGCIGASLSTDSTDRNQLGPYRRRIVMISNALRKSVSGYTNGRPRRSGAAGAGIRCSGSRKVIEQKEQLDPKRVGHGPITAVKFEGRELLKLPPEPCPTRSGDGFLTKPTYD